MSATKRLRISGRVQGVGFRAHMLRKARALGVTGWVRNRLDGTVEAVVQGAPDAVAAIIAAARRGPPGAVVTEIAVSEAEGRHAEFSMLPTE